MKKLISIMLLFLSLSFFSSPPRVFSEPSLQEKIDQLKQEKESKEAAIDAYKKLAQEAREKSQAFKTQENDLTVEFNQVEKKISEIQFEKDQLMQQENELKDSYLLTKAKITDLNESIEEKEKQLNALINALYRDYCSRYANYLFSSKNINEIMDKGVYLKYLYETDQGFFTDLKGDKQQLAKSQNLLVEDQLSLLDVRKKKEEKETELISLRSQKDEEIIHIQELTKQNQEMIITYTRAEEQTEATVQNIIRNILKLEEQKKWKNTEMGAIIWPINGPVSSEFGMRMHPIFGVYRLHTGLDIDQDYGYPIKAVAKGSVAYAGWLTGYGNCVLIQHDGKHSSLYAHMNSIYVKEGTDVEQGFIIGEVGSTGWSTGPHLHFEIRLNGDCVNPRNYLP